MGSTNQNTGQVPQEVPQQYAPGQNFTPSPTYQAPDASLPQILSTLGGLGLNVAGIFTHAGAAGNDSLQHASRLASEDAASAKENYALQKDASREVKDRDQARALFARINELPKAQQPEFTAAAKNGDVARQFHILDRNENFNRTAENLKKREDDGFFKQTRADLTTQLGQAKYQADLATKSINPAADEALKEQNFFAAQQNPDKMSMQDLVNKWNLTKGNKQIKDKASQAALYDRFRTQIVETSEPNNAISNIPGIGQALANTSIAKSLFGKTADQPFEGYAAKQVSPTVLQQHQQSVVVKAQAEQQKSKAYDALHALNSTQDKGEAVAKAQAVMAGSQEAPQAAPAPSAVRQVKDAKGNLYNQDLKTGALTPVKAGK